jgi:uncharacterized membrane protein
MASPSRFPWLLLGIGLGGFLDGIVLHQILQWHHMLSAEGCCSPRSVAGLEDNTLADGLFHLATWLAVVAGLMLVTGARRRGLPAPAARVRVGLMTAGWGLFNVVEGLVDHVLLGLHHVRDDVSDPAPWDAGFLAFGLLLLVGGLALARRGARTGGSAAAES